MRHAIRPLLKLLAIAFLAISTSSACCLAQSFTNILGMGGDTLANGIMMSNAMKFNPARFWRFEARWNQINPVPGQYNWTNNPGCTDAMMANAALQHRVVMFDVAGWPLWVQNDWTNRYQHMAGYVTAVLHHWPQIQILGCWNEPSNTQVPAAVLLPGLTNGTSAQLMPEYHALVTAIYNAKQSVRPSVQLDVGKFVNYSNYAANFALLKSLGTWKMADYITWHDYDNAYPGYDPLHDLLRPGNAPIPSVPHKVQMALALFPGKMVGSDEYINNDMRTTIRAAAAYRASGASMLIDPLLNYPTPVHPDPVYAAQYGADENFSPTPRSQQFIKILTMSPRDFVKLWRSIQNEP